MKVCYAVNEVIGGPGIGTPAYYACGALADKKWLQQALALGYKKIGRQDFAVQRAVPFGKLCSNLSFGMRRLLPSFPAYTLRDNVFDAFAAKKLRQCDIFHGWNQHCLRMLHKAKKWDTTTIVERGSTHVDFQNAILQEEYRKYGVSFRPIEPAMMKKCRKEFALADYILVNSEFSRRTFLDAGIAADKLLLVHRGVEVEHFSAQANPRSEKFTVLFAGLISLRKGIQYLLEAWEQLNLPDAQLVLAGNSVPDGRAVLRKYAHIPSIVHKGFVADMRKEYRNASVFVLPSLEEGSAKVTFEAMAAWLPVITTPNSGSVIRNGKEGFIVPIRDAKALREKIQYFYDNRQDIAKFGKQGRALAKRYTWEHYQRDLLRFYQKVC